MNYQQTVDFLFSRLPMFHRIGAAAYKANLDNINALVGILGHPEKKIKTIHIAGTNGKGSVSNLIASVFTQAGYKTGLFTSPHLKDFRERIRVNGQMISEEFVVNFVEDYFTEFEKIQPSFFEWTTALAFYFFSKSELDVAVIETGLGGRLDSTNIITPELSVITNISFDHKQLLGDSLDKIAFEKSGIIKRNIPVVVGERQTACEEVFIKRASELKSELIFASDHFICQNNSEHDGLKGYRVLKDGLVYFENLKVSLLGEYQQKNISTALQSIEKLRMKFQKINEEQIEKGILNIYENTGFDGRWKILNVSPLTIADVGHNEAGIQHIVHQLSGIRNSLNVSNVSSNVQSKLHMVIGVVNDKEISAILSLLPVDAEYYFCKAAIPRALDADELKRQAAEFGLKGESFFTVDEAFQMAKQKANLNDIIFIGGSTFVVAEVV